MVDLPQKEYTDAEVDEEMYAEEVAIDDDEELFAYNGTYESMTLVSAIMQAQEVKAGTRW